MFGAMMEVNLVNDGPVTLILDSADNTGKAKQEKQLQKQQAWQQKKKANNDNTNINRKQEENVSKTKETSPASE
jgi:sortase (surface protein transpeptidase)